MGHLKQLFDNLSPAEQNFVLHPIDFSAPPIVIDPTAPKGTILLISQRKWIGGASEPEAAWAKRCVVMTNVGESDA